MSLIFRKKRIIKIVFCPVRGIVFIERVLRFNPAFIGAALKKHKRFLRNSDDFR